MDDMPTGRRFKSEPNLQNIPIRRELGRDIRPGFVSPIPERKGREMTMADAMMRVVTTKIDEQPSTHFTREEWDLLSVKEQDDLRWQAWNQGTRILVDDRDEL